mgnify:CR=1 FL=1
MTTDRNRLLIIKNPEVANILRFNNIPVFKQFINGNECFAVNDCDEVREILLSSHVSFDNLIIGKTNRITFN